MCIHAVIVNIFDVLHAVGQLAVGSGLKFCFAFVYTVFFVRELRVCVF